MAPWSLPPVVWQPYEQLNPDNPLHPVLAGPNVESEADGVKRFRAHYKAVKEITTPVPRPRKLTRHAEWYVLNVVCAWTHAAIAAAESDPDGVEVSTVTRAFTRSGICSTRNRELETALLLHRRQRNRMAISNRHEVPDCI